ncbi:PTS system, IIC component [Paenibacillus terrae HPL-003]|uniref:Permease IIC component n=1 Tax=Paenibacillus terrae (strain HPL-003) TaxID=985665 RepID=G7VXY2_PAETH|nr:PTS transporter subunit EIIC [Paenibacillus terrae]AET57160.1 PTS system, IIC component [Paenibacillus terrae HPL-003]
MHKFIDWLTNKFAPAAQALFAKPYLAAVSGAMTKILPFILTGSLIYIYQIFQSFFSHVLPDLSMLLLFSFKMLGLLTAFMVAQQVMEKLDRKNYAIPAGLTAILVFLVFINPVFDETQANVTFSFGRFGPTGMFVALCAGIMVGMVFHFFAKLNILGKNETLPDFVKEWVRNILPIFTNICIATLLVLGLHIDIYQIIVNLFAPINSFAQTLPGFMLLSFLQVFFFTLGVSPWVWGAIRNPIFMVAIAANAAAVAAGDNPVHIVTYETMFTLGLLTLGGQGSPLPLVALMLKSKSKKLRQFARIVVGPAIFNISEPIMYGLPIVFNPLLMVPMWIISLLGPVLIWIIMKSGLLTIPSIVLQTGNIPAPFSSWLITQDWRAILWWCVFFLIYIFIWYPFFKVFEKKTLEEESLSLVQNEE